MLRTRLLLALPFIWTAACANDDDRPEQLEKLRTLGVLSTPIIHSLSTAEETNTATLTFFLSTPLGSEIAIEPFSDPAAMSPLPEPLTVVENSEKYDDLLQTRLYQVQATVNLPQENETYLAKLNQSGSLTLRYGLKFTSGSEEEKVIGDVVIYKDKDALLWQNPTIQIIEPVNDADISSSSTSLNAVLTNTNAGETYKIGWFVTSGKIKNRRSLKTELKETDTGNVTIIATVRGSRSGTFAYATVDVHAQ